jgi:hypothetical protein
MLHVPGEASFERWAAAAVTEAAAHRGAAAVIVAWMQFLALGAGTGRIGPLADTGRPPALHPR